MYVSRCLAKMTFLPNLVCLVRGTSGCGCGPGAGCVFGDIFSRNAGFALSIAMVSAMLLRSADNFEGPW